LNSRSTTQAKIDKRIAKENIKMQEIYNELKTKAMHNFVKNIKEAKTVKEF
jgi:hypothetical protein